MRNVCAACGTVSTKVSTLDAGCWKRAPEVAFHFWHRCNQHHYKEANTTK